MNAKLTTRNLRRAIITATVANGLARNHGGTRLPAAKAINQGHRMRYILGQYGSNSDCNQ